MTQLLRSLTQNHPAFDDSSKEMKTSHRSGQEDLLCDQQEKAIRPLELATHGNTPHAKETQEFHPPMSFQAKPARAPDSCGPTPLPETDNKLALAVLDSSTELVETYKEWKPG